jgi:hypothetical protein
MKTSLFPTAFLSRSFFEHNNGFNEVLLLKETLRIVLTDFASNDILSQSNMETF